jgi:hypothetical protein
MAAAAAGQQVFLWDQLVLVIFADLSNTNAAIMGI